MVLSFKYQTVTRPSLLGKKRVPSIPVTLIGDNASLDVIGQIDSGADYTALPYDLAKYLGLDLSAEPEKIGALGSFLEAIKSKVTLVIKKGHERYPIIVDCMVINCEEEVPILIGRSGFFEHFLVTINESEHTVILKRNGVHNHQL